MPYIRKLQPTGPWLTDADMRHDAVVEIECPCFHNGMVKKLDIKFALSSLREFQAQRSAYLVVDKNLIDTLMHQYLLQIEIAGKRPDVVPHLDYPNKHFLVYVNTTFRLMHDPVIGPLQVPAPVQYVAFFAGPGLFGKRNGRNKTSQ